jgi:hypothetical protein
MVSWWKKEIPKAEKIETIESQEEIQNMYASKMRHEEEVRIADEARKKIHFCTCGESEYNHTYKYLPLGFSRIRVIGGCVYTRCVAFLPALDKKIEDESVG